MTGVVWPSEQKLQRLRQEGIVAISPLSLRLMACIGIVVWLLLGGDALVTLSRAAYGAESLEAFWNDAEPSLLGVLFGPLLLSSLFLVVIGFAQSRFLFSLTLISLRLDRLWNVRVVPSESDVFRLLMYLTGPVLALGCGLGAFFYVLYPMLSLLKLDADKVPAAIWEGWSNLVPLLIGVQLVCMFASLLLGRLMFRWRHRMSLDEVRKEAEES